MFKVLPKFRSSICLMKNYCTKNDTSSSNQIISENESIALQKLFLPQYRTPRQVWLENLDTIDEKKLGILELHPEVFAVNPRIDIIHQNARWQKLYRYVSWAHTKSRFEVRGGGKKPWPQKGKK